MLLPVTEHIAKSARHTTFYLACGSAHRPMIIFVHGWPELSVSWRHQLPCFASLGFRAIAPDMRGYGRSSVYHNHADYALEHIVQDMLELLDALGQAQKSDALIFAVFTGNPWHSQNLRDLAAERALETLTGETGGEVLKPRLAPRKNRSRYDDETDDLSLKELDQTFDNLAEQLRTQYVLGFYSTNEKRDGSFRKLSVRIKKPGYQARARTGYYAPKD